jgi:hypothetical protein
MQIITNLLLSEWLIIQRRVNTNYNWALPWSDYKAGFGSPDDHFWLGLEAIHQLTSNADYQLRIEFHLSGTGMSYWAEYASFEVLDEGHKYQLSVMTFSGNSTNVLANSDASGCGSDGNHNGMKFSTFDNDRDVSGKLNCAVELEGGWWFKKCACFCPTCGPDEGYNYDPTGIETSLMYIKPVL